MVTKFVKEIARVEVPEENTGRIYSEKTLDEAFAEYQVKIDQGISVGGLGYEHEESLVATTHVITAIERQNGIYYAAFQMLDTPWGKMAQEKVDRGCRAVKVGEGKIDTSTMEVSEYKLLQINLV